MSKKRFIPCQGLPGTLTVAGETAFNVLYSKAYSVDSSSCSKDDEIVIRSSDVYSTFPAFHELQRSMHRTNAAISNAKCKRKRGANRTKFSRHVHKDELLKCIYAPVKCINAHESLGMYVTLGDLKLLCASLSKIPANAARAVFGSGVADASPSFGKLAVALYCAVLYKCGHGKVNHKNLYNAVESKVPESVGFYCPPFLGDSGRETSYNKRFSILHHEGSTDVCFIRLLSSHSLNFILDALLEASKSAEGSDKVRIEYLMNVACAYTSLGIITVGGLLRLAADTRNPETVKCAVDLVSALENTLKAKASGKDAKDSPEACADAEEDDDVIDAEPVSGEGCSPSTKLHLSYTMDTDVPKSVSVQVCTGGLSASVVNRIAELADMIREVLDGHAE